MHTMKMLFVLFFMFFHAHFVFGQSVVDVVDNTFKVPARGEEIFYYGFAEGDQLVFNFEEVNGKELKEIEISVWPSSVKFMDYKSVKVENKRIVVNATGIYRFRFSNSALSGRVCKVKIQREPSTNATKNFRTDVLWRTVYDTVGNVRQERYLAGRELKVVRLVKDKYNINSASKVLLNGKSRVLVPVTVPANTVSLYYTFSAYRDKAMLESTHANVNLLGQLSRLIDPTGLSKVAITSLAAPPGGNACDIYELTPIDAQRFVEKLSCSVVGDGTRENLTSGVVQINSYPSPMFYLGIRNSDMFYAIGVSLEVVAVTMNERWDTRNVKDDVINSRQEPYLAN